MNKSVISLLIIAFLSCSNDPVFLPSNFTTIILSGSDDMGEDPYLVTYTAETSTLTYAAAEFDIGEGGCEGSFNVSNGHLQDLQDILATTETWTDDDFNDFDTHPDNDMFIDDVNYHAEGGCIHAACAVISSQNYCAINTWFVNRLIDQGEDIDTCPNFFIPLLTCD